MSISSQCDIDAGAAPVAAHVEGRAEGALKGDRLGGLAERDLLPPWKLERVGAERESAKAHRQQGNRNATGRSTHSPPSSNGHART